MTDICQWLAQIGLAHYSDLFEKNELRTDVLADLSEGDLKELGVPLGDRKRILRTVAALRTKPRAASLPSLGSAGEETQLEPAEAGAERRQLTVSFMWLFTEGQGQDGIGQMHQGLSHCRATGQRARIASACAFSRMRICRRANPSEPWHCSMKPLVPLKRAGNGYGNQSSTAKG
jgi:hypothetical protein